MTWMEMIELTRVAMKLDKIANYRGYVQGPEMYKELKKTSSELHSVVQEEMKRKRKSENSI